MGLFRAISYLLADTEELYVYIGLKVAQYIWSNGEYIQNVQAYLKQSKIKQNIVRVTENEILVTTKLIYRDIVMY